MGIQGLLPFVKKASREVNIKEFSGCTAAVDTYCWLHKGAFSCAERLVKGEKTDGYVVYCMKMASTLISAGVRPILVFDGQRLPSKKLTEKKRREQREANRKKAKEFLIEGKLKEAREYYQRAVDITSEMALDLIKECRRRGIDYIVAPYEADAQLAYLAKNKMADIVVTEDSDLILFGCDKVIFKMDQGGHGVLFEQSEVGRCFGSGASCLTPDKFRQMCILSGCDYLQNLPGIGLARAFKFFRLASNPDLRKTLPKLPSYLKMPTLNVSKEYVEAFLRAEKTFLHQLVFCPMQNTLVPLNPYGPDVDPRDLTYAGEYVSKEVAFQIAVGNIDVNTGLRVDDYHPADGKVLRLGKKDDSCQITKMTPSANSTPKMTRLGAFEVTRRKATLPAPSPTTLSTSPAKRPAFHPLKSVENLSPEGDVGVEDHSNAPREGFEQTSPVADDEKHRKAHTATRTPENKFKVAAKPVILRSRFFSSPSTKSPASVTDTRLTKWQRKLEDDASSTNVSAVSLRRPSPMKFQWSSKQVGTTAGPISCSASTPFKKLRLSLSAVSAAGDRPRPEKETVSSEDDSGEAVVDSSPDENVFNSGSAHVSPGKDKHRGDAPSVDVEKRNVLSGVPSVSQLESDCESPLGRTAATKRGAVKRVAFNPFAKKLQGNQPQPPALNANLDWSDDEDPLLRHMSGPANCSGLDSSPEKEEQKTRGSADCALVEESPIPRAARTETASGNRPNPSEGLEDDKEIYDEESPWPTPRKKIVSGTEECDDADLTVVKEFIVSKFANTTPKDLGVRQRVPAKPVKKVPAKTRRLGLSKSADKRDASQPSIMETLAKFRYKQ